MPIRLAQRVSRVKPSATLAVTAKAQAMRAEGHDIIGFGAGEPDFDTPEPIKEAAVKALAEGFTKYTPVAGIPELKAAIVEKFARENGLTYTPQEIAVSCGAKHCLYNLFQACFEAGDEVLIPVPYWVSYPDMAYLADATPVFVPPMDDGSFKVSPEAVRELVTPRSRALVLNSPSNPTGAAYSEEELRALAAVAEEADLLVVSDEIYEHIVYDGFRHVSVAALSPELKARTMVVNGHSKTFSMTGWRIGYIAGDKDVIAAISKIQSQSTSNPTSFAQRGAVEALRGPMDEVAAMVEEFSRRRDRHSRRAQRHRRNKLPRCPRGPSTSSPTYRASSGENTKTEGLRVRWTSRSSCWRRPGWRWSRESPSATTGAFGSPTPPTWLPSKRA